MADAYVPLKRATPGMTLSTMRCVVCGDEFEKDHPPPGHPHSDQEWQAYCTANSLPLNSPRFEQIDPPPLPPLPDGTVLARGQRQE